MTVKQVQELYYIATSQDDDLDKSIKMVAAYTGRTPAQVEAMGINRFNRLCKTISLTFELIGRQQFKGKPRKYIYRAGRLYRLNYDVKQLAAGQYVEGLTFGKDVINNLHKLLATMAQPINWRGKVYELDHETKARDMEGVDFGVAYHAAVFFFLYYEASMKATQPYLIRKAVKGGMRQEEAEQSLTALWTLLAGLPMPKWSQDARVYLSHRFGI